MFVLNCQLMHAGVVHGVETCAVTANTQTDQVLAAAFTDPL